MSRSLRFPIALHPISRRNFILWVSFRRVADDSRRVLGSSPNRGGERLQRRFRRNLRREQVLAASRPLSREPPKRLGNTGPGY